MLLMLMPFRFVVGDGQEGETESNARARWAAGSFGQL